MDGPKSGGKKENVVKAACGVTFSIVLTDTGKGESRRFSFVIRCLNLAYRSLFLWKW